jgi:hypothetical protein
MGMLKRTRAGGVFPFNGDTGPTGTPPLTVGKKPNDFEKTGQLAEIEAASAYQTCYEIFSVCAGRSGSQTLNLAAAVE